MIPELRLGLGRTRWPLIVFGVVAALFLVLPLLVIIPTSWTSGDLVQFPPKGFSLQWYRAAFDGNMWTAPFWVSVRLSLIASLIATVLGTATALGMRRLRMGRSTRLAQSLFILPLALPTVAYALGLYQVFTKLSESLNNSLLPLILGEATIAMPLVYVVVAGAMAGVDPRLSRAASTLGARWPMVVWRIELPLIKLAILGGFVFAFATIFDEATLAIFLGPVGQLTIAQALYQAASQSLQPTLSAVSTMITALAILILVGGTLLTRRRPRGAGSGALA
jgi:putative spermidine/putrescine transport system permease protein